MLSLADIPFHMLRNRSLICKSVYIVSFNSIFLQKFIVYSTAPKWNIFGFDYCKIKFFWSPCSYCYEFLCFTLSYYYWFLLSMRVLLLLADKETLIFRRPVRHQAIFRWPMTNCLLYFPFWLVHYFQVYDDVDCTILFTYCQRRLCSSFI